MSAAQDLLIIGAGTLGQRVARRWAAQHDAARVVAETRTPSRHEALRAVGASPRLRSDPRPAASPNVLLSVPPSSQRDHAAEATRAARLFDGTGRLVVTSSTGVYAATDGERCVEDSPVAGHPRAERLLAAEAIVRDAGGCAVRLAGLYDHHRGPHRVYLRQRSSPRRPDGLVNLIHYDDAAALVVAALERGRAGATYLGCDDAPLTRRALVEATIESERYGEGRKPCRFEGSDGPVGRRCDSRATRAALRWQPEIRSFAAWIGRASASGSFA